MKKSVRAALAAILMLALTLGLLAPLAHASEAEPYRAALNNYGIHAEAAWDAGLTGEGVTVAVIDTGLNAGHLYGPKHITPGRYFYWLERENGRYILPDGKRYDYFSNDDTTDCVGHGTAMAGIIADIAPGVNIIPVRWCDEPSDFFGWNSTIISSINYAVEQGADVINLSLGSYRVSARLHETIRQAIDAGCIVIAAAGNDGDTTISFPSAYDEVVSVGAIDKAGHLASFSQRNGNTNVCAPGQDIRSTSWTSPTALVEGSGTSFSTAIVSGAVALVKEANPDMRQEELMELLEQSCDPVVLSDGSLEMDAGAGALNVEKLMQSAVARRTAQECVQVEMDLIKMGGCKAWRWLCGEKVQTTVIAPMEWFITACLHKILQSSLR